MLDHRRAGRGARAVPLVFVVLWSSAFVAAVIGVGAAPPLLLTACRFAAAGLLLTGWALLTRAPWPRGRALGHVAVTGLLLQAVQFAAFYTAIGAGLPGGVVATIQGLNPVLIAVLAGPVLGERIGPRRWAGFAIGAAGVALAVADRLQASAGALALCALGLVGLSAGTVHQKRRVPDLDVRSGTAVQFLVAAVPVTVLSLLLETPRVTDPARFGAALAWIVLVNSVGTFVLLNLMVGRMPASRVGTLFFLTPAVTALLAWIVLGQTLSRTALIGMAIAAAGVLLAAPPALRRASRAATPPRVATMER